MGFDYGVDKEKVTRIESNIKVWPTEGRKTALVDADAIAYLVGYTSDLQEYLKAKRTNKLLETDVWKRKADQANFILNKWVSAAGCDSAKLYLTDGSSNFRIKIAKAAPYKGQRKEDKPPFFEEVRRWLLDFQGAILSNCCEADDEISIEAWKRHLAILDGEVKPWSWEHQQLANFVVISGDKDLGIIPGWRCPPDGVLEWVDPIGKLDPVWRLKDVVAYEYWPLFDGELINIKHCKTIMKYAGKLQARGPEDVLSTYEKWELDYVWRHDGGEQDTYSRGAKKGKGKFKRVKVGTTKKEYLHKLKGTGLKFFYSQLLTGDTVDNYKGVPDIGIVRAYDMLNDASTEKEMLDIVIAAYFDHWGKTRAMGLLIEQGRLAHMQTYPGELWTIPDTETESTFPIKEGTDGES